MNMVFQNNFFTARHNSFKIGLISLLYYLRNINIFRVDIQLYQHEWNWKNKKLCGNTTPTGQSVFTKFRVFPISTSVDITVYLYGKNVLHFSYNIAQKNTRLLQWISDRKFFVFTSSYVNTALNQSAFRIHKCYIIKEIVTMMTSFFKPF